MIVDGNLYARVDGYVQEFDARTKSVVTRIAVDVMGTRVEVPVSDDDLASRVISAILSGERTAESPEAPKKAALATRAPTPAPRGMVFAEVEASEDFEDDDPFGAG